MLPSRPPSPACADRPEPELPSEPTGQDPDVGQGTPPQEETEKKKKKKKRRGPGPFVLLVLPGLVSLTGVATFFAVTGGFTVESEQAAGPEQAAAPGVDASYVPWLRKAAADCEVVSPSVLAAQIDQLTGWTDDTGKLSGQRGIAAFTDEAWHTWGKDSDGNGRSTPRDPADAIMALGRQDCSLTAEVTDLRTEGRVNGDLVDLLLAAYATGVDEVAEAGGVPDDARTYVTEVKGLLSGYASLDKEETSGAPTAAGAILAAPVSTLTVTSPYGSREHPLTGVTKLHTGIDFAAAQGAQVFAARGGQVVFAASTSAYGNRIVVDHGEIEGKRLQTTYSHLSSIEVAVGQTVETGTPIGRAGSTGLSTGPHLHFEVIYDGYYSNPQPWLAPSG
ncbi:M23 family metallopeptidase [Streptomyces sp. CRN 30]|uniref:M23 family metallopeptidase n=1 Tax=Streptomyces sp. CRN 30 TaxID=3075613 RepID=UPI002A81470F|nr:M23 family metallopeptidase [Streptomyces sp. CRN 30]